MIFTIERLIQHGMSPRTSCVLPGLTTHFYEVKILCGIMNDDESLEAYPYLVGKVFGTFTPHTLYSVDYLVIASN